MRSRQDQALGFGQGVLAGERHARFARSGKGPGYHPTRQELLQATSVLVRDGLATIDRLLDTVGVPRTAVEFCLVTGGMSAMPAIREGLIQYFDAARVRTASNAVTSIAEGAAWIAHDGVRITLAKPIEVLNADDVYLPVFRSGTMLPLEGDQISEPMSLYCVDPRDQKAKLQ